MSEPWFARRFPVGDRRNSMAPVHRRGNFVSGAFVAVMLVGALGFVLFALARLVVAGFIFFFGVAVLAAVGFIAISQAKGDNTRTVADFRKDQDRV